MKDRLPVVAVHPSRQALGQEEGGRVLQEAGPHTGRQLLQEERSQLAPDSGQALLGWTVVPEENTSMKWRGNYTENIRGK